MLINSLLAIVDVKEIEFQQDSFSTGFLNLLFRGKGILFLFWKVDKADIGSFSCIENGYRSANTRVSAGDEDGFVFKQAPAFIFFEVWFLAVIVPELREREKGRG